MKCQRILYIVPNIFSIHPIDTMLGNHIFPVLLII